MKHIDQRFFLLFLTTYLFGCLGSLYKPEIPFEFFANALISYDLSFLKYLKCNVSLCNPINEYTPTLFLVTETKFPFLNVIIAPLN